MANGHLCTSRNQPIGPANGAYSTVGKGLSGASFQCIRPALAPHSPHCLLALPFMPLHSTYSEYLHD